MNTIMNLSRLTNMICAFLYENKHEKHKEIIGCFLSYL